MLWLQTVGGKLKTDLRYSNELCYNTFPFPEISENIKNDFKRNWIKTRVLDERESILKKLFQNYMTLKVCLKVKNLHQEIDIIVKNIINQNLF